MCKQMLKYVKAVALYVLSVLLLPACGQGQMPRALVPSGPWWADSAAAHWADSVVQTLPLERMLAQSMMVGAYPRQGEKHLQELERLVERAGIGGVLLFQGSLQQEAQLVNRLQGKATLPLLMALDAEWGLGMRIDDAISYPKAMALAATGNPALSYRLGAVLAQQMRQLGIQINFAPVVDVNTNPRNPVIGQRAFADLPTAVAEYGMAFSLGLEQNGVYSCAKHFPGHGDTHVDSHKGLPRVESTMLALDTVALVPFRMLVASDVSMLMVGHLAAPALGTEPEEPISLYRGLGSIVRDSLHFQGLICSDALNMQGATQGLKPVEVNVKAYTAGHDILLCPDQVEATIARLAKQVRSHPEGGLDSLAVVRRAARVLQAKYHLMGPKVFPIDTAHLVANLHSEEYLALRDEIATGSVTLLQANTLPSTSLEPEKVGYVSLLGSEDSLQYALNAYTGILPFSVDPKAIPADLSELQAYLQGKEHILLAVQAFGYSPSNWFGLKKAMPVIEACLRQARVSLLLFGVPYALSALPLTPQLSDVVLSYSLAGAGQRRVAEVVVGASQAEGQLPVALPSYFARGTGLPGRNDLRLSTTLPADMRLDRMLLRRADSIAFAAIDSLAMPGMQVYAGSHGVLYYHKQFGRTTYAPGAPRVCDTTRYDLASLTKIVATLPVIMHDYGQGTFSLEDSLRRAWPALDSLPCGSLQIGDILLHQAQLPPWLPFYMQTIDCLYPMRPLMQPRYSREYCVDMGYLGYMTKHIVLSPRYYCDHQCEAFPIPVSRHLYATTQLRDSIISSIAHTKLRPEPGYKYSDWGFILLQQWLERRHKQGLDVLADSLFYKPLRMRRTCFTPGSLGYAAACAPSEHDVFLRKEVVQGYVQDLVCAMMGGVSGHAGLFSTAHDLAIYAQMLLNGGTYAGRRYLDSAVVALFSSCPTTKNGNYRGYGFDKRNPRVTRSQIIGDDISASSFGHTGYTGTVLWLDPAKNFFFILLSNRTFPESSNTLINRLKVRANLMNALYNAVLR